MFTKKIFVHEWQALNQRIERLEEKAFGKKKPPITLYQQILILEHLGMLDAIRQLDVSNVKKSQLLSLLLKGDASNTKKAMEALAKKNDPSIINEFNYEYLFNLFEEYDLNDKKMEANKVLRDLENQK